MSTDNNIEINNELKERIKSIKNIGYFIYTSFSSTTIICTAITTIVMLFAIAFLGEWYNTKWIALGAFFGLAVIIISVIVLYNYFKKQYLVELQNGKSILIVGGFRRFRRYYFNNGCYTIKKGQAHKITPKKRETVKLLFSEIRKCEIIKKAEKNKEIYSIKRKVKEDALSLALGGGLPAKYAEMTFVDGKFKKGSYTSTIKMNYTLHFRVVKYDIKYNDIVPQSILNLFKKDVVHEEFSETTND